MNYDTLKLAVEGLSAKNTVVLDDRGMPSVMVRIPKFKQSDVIDGATQDVHPAFVVNGVEKDQILVSKYQNIVKDGRAYSLPMMDPKAYTDFDQAKAYCEAKGSGFHLLTNAERAAIALWSKKNGTMPRGNNNHGSDHSAPHERGVKTYGSGDTIYRVGTGSGPASWSHDGTGEGIYDLNGNVWEWMSGMRLVDGEIQVIPYNNAASQVDESSGSTLWKAILEDGSLVAPGTSGTLKIDGETTTPSGIKLNTSITNATTDSTSLDKTFETIAAASGVTVPQILNALALAPIDSSHGEDKFYARNNDERLPFFGGRWINGSGAGVFSVNLYSPRSSSNLSIGFRSAYAE